MAVKKFEHKVIAAQIVAKIPGASGGEVYLRRGRSLPTTVETDEVKRLLALGLIEKIEIAEEPADDAAATAAAEAAAKKAADDAAKKAADDAAKKAAASQGGN